MCSIAAVASHTQHICMFFLQNEHSASGGGKKKNSVFQFLEIFFFSGHTTRAVFFCVGQGRVFGEGRGGEGKRNRIQFSPVNHRCGWFSRFVPPTRKNIPSSTIYVWMVLVSNANNLVSERVQMEEEKIQKIDNNNNKSADVYLPMN